VHPLVGWTVALAIAASGGFAEMVGAAVTGTPTSSLTPIQGEGTGVSEASPWLIARPRAVAREASRSRHPDHSPAVGGTGTLTDTTCYVWSGHRTASGLWPKPGMAANNAYPFGTRLNVEGVGVVTVQDRIGHGSDLDLFFPSLPACLRFGRQQLRVRVLR